MKKILYLLLFLSSSFSVNAQTFSLFNKKINVSDSAWSLLGNGNTNAGTNFLGTTDFVDLVFKRNNIRAGLLHTSNTAFGVNALSASTRDRNTAIGVEAMKNNTNGDDNVAIGPYVHLRPGTHLKKGVKVGNFMEIKNSIIGEKTKLNHLSYIGDADLGANINIGCGTITVNYDGKNKFRTTIEDRAFIGCNSNLVAPVTIGEGAFIAAGSTITKDVPSEALGVARAKQSNIEGWAQKKK